MAAGYRSRIKQNKSMGTRTISILQLHILAMDDCSRSIGKK